MQNEEVLEKPENYSKQQDFRGSNGDSRGWSRVSHRHGTPQYLQLESLYQCGSWVIVPWSEADNVIISTWAFKLKRLPDGTPSKLNVSASGLLVYHTDSSHLSLTRGMDYRSKWKCIRLSWPYRDSSLHNSLVLNQACIWFWNFENA